MEKRHGAGESAMHQSRNRAMYEVKVTDNNMGFPLLAAISPKLFRNHLSRHMSNSDVIPHMKTIYKRGLGIHR